MAFWPSGIATPHELRTQDRLGRDLVFLSGVAVFSFRGRSTSYWRKDTLYIVAGPRWRQLLDVTPYAGLNSIYNRKKANDAGWAVDAFTWTTYGGRILLRANVAVRDTDGYLLRVGYQMTALGRV